MSGFYPDGYVPTQEAIARAAEYWFPERFAALKIAAAPQPQAKPDNGVDAAARAFSPPPQIPETSQREFADIANQTVHRLRNLLHQGELKAYYFADDGSHAVPCEFWATTAADGVLEMGTLWPFGQPTAWYERRPSYPLFLAQLELGVLLSNQHTTKRHLAATEIPKLVAALRNLAHLSRPAQRDALRELPEFRGYRITEKLFREAAQKVPRGPGRKSRQRP